MEHLDDRSVVNVNMQYGCDDLIFYTSVKYNECDYQI